MVRRNLYLLLACAALVLSSATASAAPTFVFLRGFQDPSNFEARFNSCIAQFKSADGLAGSILKQLNGAEVVVYYQKGAAGTDNPNPGGNSKGDVNYLYWDSNLSGKYTDGAPKVPCAALLHELEHASRFFAGTECTGAFDDNRAAYEYDEKLGSRAENFWLALGGRKQRTSYPFFGKTLKLDRWARWPALSSAPVPKAPLCRRSCPNPQSAVAVSNSTSDVVAATCRCTAFHQAGCFDFAGAIVSGGDHRRVANGSLKIIVGDLGYCQDRPSCEFKDQTVAPHLDTAFPEGLRVTAIATPGEDSMFARWGPGACQGKGQTCTFTATKDSCITAQFLLTNPTAPPQSLPTVPCPEDP